MSGWCRNKRDKSTAKSSRTQAPLSFFSHTNSHSFLSLITRLKSSSVSLLPFSSHPLQPSQLNSISTLPSHFSELSSLPFSALLAAQNSISKSKTSSSSSSSSTSSSEEASDSEVDEFDQDRKPLSASERRKKIKAELRERKEKLQNGTQEKLTPKEEREREKEERRKKMLKSRKLEDEREDRGRRNKHA